VALACLSGRLPRRSPELAVQLRGGRWQPHALRALPASMLPTIRPLTKTPELQLPRAWGSEPAPAEASSSPSLSPPGGPHTRSPELQLPRAQGSEPTPAEASSSPSLSPPGGPHTRSTELRLPRARGSEPAPAEASSSPSATRRAACDRRASSDTQVSHTGRSAPDGVTGQNGKGMFQNSTGLRVIVRRAGPIRNRISW
jgi:hypothetical protein